MYSMCRFFKERDSYKSQGNILIARMLATRGAKPAACICLARPKSIGKRSVSLINCLIEYCSII